MGPYVRLTPEESGQAGPWQRPRLIYLGASFFADRNDGIDLSGPWCIV